MAPKRVAELSLADVKASAEELAAAKKIIETLDPKARRSKMQSMAAFLRGNSTPENAAVLATRGEAREKYLLEYLTHINRRKASATTVSSSSKSSSTTKGGSQATWMSAFEMDATYGSAKGSAWRSSGKLTKRADPLTGSMEEDVVEYKVSRDFDLSETVETKEMVVCASGDCDMGDLENVNAMKQAETQALLGDDDQPLVKKEPKSDSDLETERVTRLLADPSIEIKRFQSALVDLEELSPKLESLKYGAELFADCGKAIARITKIVKNLKRLVATPKEVQRGEVPKLLQVMDKEFDHIKNIKVWASKFGLMKQGQKRKSKE